MKRVKLILAIAILSGILISCNVLGDGVTAGDIVTSVVVPKEVK